MAPEKKRKRSQETSAINSKSPATKKTKPTTPSAAEKRQKSSLDTSGPAPTNIPSTLRAVNDEETSFPRGGASVLTPLEHREIANEAARDALFDASGAAASGEDGAEAGVKKSKKKHKKESKKTNKKDQVKEQVDNGPRVESLSYKRLASGTLVLGCIEKINTLDIALSLPNNLTGFIPLKAISEKVTEKVETLEESDSEDSESEDEEDDENDIDLQSMFKVGQYLRAYVVHTHEEAKRQKGESESVKTRTKKRIELSLYPSLVNEGISKNELVVGCTVQAAITSIEDHGMVMDLGIEGDIKGFLSSKELPQGLSASNSKEGQVFLCAVTGLSSNGKIVKLSADLEQKFSKKGKLAGGKGAWWLHNAPTIDAFLPGTGVEILVTDVGKQGGIVGKIMGMLDTVADYFHVAGWDEKALDERIKPGNKIKARVTSTFPNSDPKKVAVSILPHIISLTPASETNPLASLPVATILNSAKITAIEPRLGLFVDIGIPGVCGFVHISRISSETKIERIDADTGAYKLGTSHLARVMGYNPMDGLLLLSMEQRVLEQPFLRVEDVKVSEIVKGKIEQILDGGSVVVNLADGINGIVDEMHLSDVKLKNPEKKFRVGSEIRARVLATNIEKRKVWLTVKKTLVNSDAPIIASYEDATPGTLSVGTLVKVLPNGAVVKFYAGVSAFLPVSEMSEAYIQDPREHFRVGQSVNVHVVSVDPETRKMRVSCKDPNSFGDAQRTAFSNIKPGQLISGKITEKSTDDLMVEIDNVGATGLKGLLVVGHLTDGSREKNSNVFRKLRAAQTLNDLIILEKNEGRRLIKLSMKPSLVHASKAGELVTAFEKVSEGTVMKGFVKNATDIGVFVGFVGGLSALALKKDLPNAVQSLPGFGYFTQQSVTATVINVDHAQQRFLVSLKPVEEASTKQRPANNNTEPTAVIDPVDGHSKALDDYGPGTVTKAKIVTVQETQINVRLAQNIQGRIDVSQVFNSWDDIKNKKQPLQGLKKDDVLDVKIIGIHDARTYRFLPISHRSTNMRKAPIFELTAKPSLVKKEDVEPLTLEKVEVDSEWPAFVNNVSSDCVWVNLSPSVRGRIKTFDLSEDIGKLQDIEKSFPIGSALKCRVTGVDTLQGRLDLSARSQPLTFGTLKKGMVLPARITKVTERQLLVQLSDAISGPVNLTDMADDYDQAKPSNHQKFDIIRVCVLDLDAPNRRINLSMRSSKVLDATLPVRDPEIQTLANVKVGDIRRGFVKNVSDKGLFVSLGGNVTAWVKISDLSDSFLKEWKSKFQVDQLVEGKIVDVDPNLNHVQLSLRTSDITGKKPKRDTAMSDLKVGQIIAGKIRKVVDYGVFIVVDGGGNVSGLCHKSQIADHPVKDITKLYSEGDTVKAKVLKVDVEKCQIAFGLKASYFKDEVESEDEDEDDEDEDGGTELNGDDDSDDGGIDLTAIKDIDGEAEMGEGDESDVEMADAVLEGTEGLDVGGFDWTGNSLDKRSHDTESSSDEDEQHKKRKKRKKSEIKQDLTLSLASQDAQSVTDFERLILGDPNDSKLWIQYMAFQLQLSELEKARGIARRAVKTISQKEDKERFNVWIAMLNMENAYGDNDSLEEVFKEACQYCDAQEVHERLASIYIQSGKTEKADDMFKVIIKKYHADPKIWFNYGSFLYSTAHNREGARELLKKAIQTLPKHHHRDLISKFAQLEFKTGDPERGRTLFENLLDTYSKRMDLWNVLLDMEMKYGGNEKEDKDRVRGLFPRALKEEKCSAPQAKFLFKKWKEYEERVGDEKTVKAVTDRVRLFVDELEKKKTGSKADGA